MTDDGLGLAEGPETARIRAFLEEAAGAAARETAGARGPEEAREEARATIAVGPGDDAAVFAPPAGEVIVVSSDAAVEDVHFRREWMTWETVGYRTAAAALSDLAAMAARPIGLTVSAALPPELGPEPAAGLGRGVGRALGYAGGVLLGGDVVASPGPVFLDVTVIGSAARPIRRSGARPGDRLWLTGALGGAAQAVHDLSRRLEPLPAARAAFERPRPRLAEARWLAGRLELHAMIDLSDGLVRDARHLARASGVALEIEAGRVPTPPELASVRETPAGERLLLRGGEDFELLLAAPVPSDEGLTDAFEAAFGVPLSEIGVVREGAGVTIRGLDGTDASALDGFDHFAGGT